jgi:hypothetical protein
MKYRPQAEKILLQRTFYGCFPWKLCCWQVPHDPHLITHSPIHSNPSSLGHECHKALLKSLHNALTGLLLLIRLLRTMISISKASPKAAAGGCPAAAWVMLLLQVLDRWTPVLCFAAQSSCLNLSWHHAIPLLILMLLSIKPLLCSRSTPPI